MTVMNRYHFLTAAVLLLCGVVVAIWLTGLVIIIRYVWGH